MTNHMTEYTAEDVARATLAKLGEFGVARRVAPWREKPWKLSTSNGFARWLSDEGMAAQGWVPVREAIPISFDALEDAWENAEQADSCRKGDMLIWKDSSGGYGVHPAVIDGPLLHARILSRAPKREPWADLADDLAEVLDADARRSEELARDLHNGGWRKGGDER